MRWLGQQPPAHCVLAWQSSLSTSPKDSRVCAHVAAAAKHNSYASLFTPQVIYSFPSQLPPDLAEQLAAFCFPAGVRPELLERTPRWVIEAWGWGWGWLVCGWGVGCVGGGGGGVGVRVFQLES